MNIGEAIAHAMQGHKVARAGWNGKGMWVAYSPGVAALSWEKFWSDANADYARSQPEKTATVLPCLTMKTATGEILMGWLASQTDLLANDWEIVK